MRDLTNFQERVLKVFGQSEFGQNFYWTGGTLLSYLYFHHRKSEDLDFFSENFFRDDEYLEFINLIEQKLNLRKADFYQSGNRRQYSLDNGQETIKLELVYFPFKTLFCRKRLKRFKVKIDSLADIMANKVLAAYQRKEPKDIFDLYYFLKYKKGDLRGLVEKVEKKFQVKIEPTLLVSKVSENIKILGVLKPLLYKPENNLVKKVETVFQEEFNKILKKRF